MGDRNDEDLVTSHHVERCEGKLFENDSPRAVLRGGYRSGASRMR